MSSLGVGMPQEADAIVMSVAASQIIKSGDAVYLSGNMEISLCDESNRKAFGIAAHDYPYVPGSSSGILYGADATDQGPSAYVSTTRDKLTVLRKGAVWLNVQIPGSGSDITLSAGDRVVCSLVAAVDGTVDLYPEDAAMNDETASKAALVNASNLIGTCLAALHLGGPSGGDKLINEPAFLGSNIPSSDKLVNDTEITYAKVPVVLNLRR